MAVKPIPDAYHTLTPYLVVESIDRQIEFLQKAFDATIIEYLKKPDGSVMHAKVKIGDSIIMMGQSTENFTPLYSSLYIYVNNTDSTYKKALDAGANSLMEPADQFYGDRTAGVKDPQGNFWWIATHIEDLTSDELQRRAIEHNKNK